jgi:hypothetical protein
MACSHEEVKHTVCLPEDLAELSVFQYLIRLEKKGENFSGIRRDGEELMSYDHVFRGEEVVLVRQ